MRLGIINVLTFEAVLSIFIVSCLGVCRGGTERKKSARSFVARDRIRHGSFKSDSCSVSFA